MTTMIFILSFNLAISVSLVLTPACVGIVLPALKLHSHEPENKPRNPFTFRLLRLLVARSTACVLGTSPARPCLMFGVCGAKIYKGFEVMGIEALELS